jgi:hypothetical protein
MRSRTNTSSNRATLSGGYASFSEPRSAAAKRPSIPWRGTAVYLLDGRTQGDYNDWNMNTPAFQWYYRS